MKTKICFVRHGRTNANINMIIQGRIDNPLNDFGINDARSVAKMLNDNHLQFDIIISSPLQRAFKTAEIIKEECYPNLTIIKNPLFMERKFGEAEGQSINSSTYQKILNDGFRGMESKKEICARSKLALDWILDNFAGKTILVVAHSHFIKSLFMQYFPEVKFDTNFGHHSPSYLIFDGKENVGGAFSTDKINF